MKPPGSRRGAGGRCGIEQGAAPHQLPPRCQALIALALARLSPAKKHRISLGFWEKKQCSGILESAQAFKCLREGKEEVLGEGGGGGGV